MQGFIKISTADKCIESYREDLREDPGRIIVTNNGKMEEKIYEEMNKTHHYLCAEYEDDGAHVTSEFCVVPFDERLDSLLKQDQTFNGTNHKRELIHQMLFQFCNIDPYQNSVSVKIVESIDQCEVHVQLLQIIMSSVTKIKIVVYIGNVVASFGILGNLLSLSTFLGNDYQRSHKTCIYFIAKTVFESLHLVLTMWYSLSLMMSPSYQDKYIEGLINGALGIFVMVGRHWLVTIISIEQCIAVKKPFLARQYLRKSTSN